MQEILSQVINTCQKTGKFIKHERTVFCQNDVRFKSKSQQDLVSYVDEKSEDLLLESLTKIEPNAGFISEESHANYKNGLNWIVDPIDGTTNFVHGIPHYAISVALVDGDDILLGVVLEVNSENCFSAIKNEASRLNDKIISVTQNNQLKSALLSTGFSVKDHGRLQDNLALLGYWVEHSRGIRRMGSAALDLCFVANGSFDAYYETGLKAWDIAAGLLIVQNAGGMATDFSGNKNILFESEVLASNGHLHHTILNQIHSVIG